MINCLMICIKEYLNIKNGNGFKKYLKASNFTVFTITVKLMQQKKTTKARVLKSITNIIKTEE